MKDPGWKIWKNDHKGTFMNQNRDEKTKKSKFRDYYDEDFSLEDDEDEMQHRKKKSSKRSHRPKTGRDEFTPGFDDKTFPPGGGKDPAKRNRR